MDETVQCNLLNVLGSDVKADPSGRMEGGLMCMFVCLHEWARRCVCVLGGGAAGRPWIDLTSVTLMGFVSAQKN